MKDVASIVRDVAAIAGVGLISYGVWQIYHPAGLIVIGAWLVVGSLILARGA